MAESKTVTISTTSLLTALGMVIAGATVFFFNHTQAEGHEGVRINRQMLYTNQAAIKANQVSVEKALERLMNTEIRVGILEGK